MSDIYIALGSNLEKPRQQIHNAVKLIGKIEGLNISLISSLYQTKPIGKTNQPDFINAVLKVEGIISPEKLHTALQDIETQAGRIRIELNGPRTLDLDILLIDNLIMKTKELTIPHPRMHLRQFVIIPLLEINHGLCVPGIGPIKDISKSLSDQGVIKV
ncbi:MAG: 2-amino-4-hydroxy-6-hydroxymethyldihydropteridine diphosphokinase [Nitrosomonadales bacterium]|jgi:2-amino-4-hydroxy-6-hydroxymethyldihydropteridine diphosphokinase|nr:2-amino-4-hydroxy-6-hydroxymethyldihydropteridine diphosphokinase [Nitrosomonadales bacterium]MBT6251484.1 2-amino-4-hydroxy-6-hydroxymethyldihydropteridine diphosphokinase [Nitrosomonadales bacterium]